MSKVTELVGKMKEVGSSKVFVKHTSDGFPESVSITIDTEAMLRVVLKAIEDGDIIYIEQGDTAGTLYPEFKQFLREK